MKSTDELCRDALCAIDEMWVLYKAVATTSPEHNAITSLFLDEKDKVHAYLSRIANENQERGWICEAQGEEVS